MHYLSWIENLPRELVVGAAAVVVLLLIWIWARYGRRHYLVIKRSDATQLVVRELARIADALERLERIPRQEPTVAAVAERASVPETAKMHEAPAVAESPVVPESPGRHVVLSMFGR